MRWTGYRRCVYSEGGSVRIIIAVGQHVACHRRIAAETQGFIHNNGRIVHRRYSNDEIASIASPVSIGDDIGGGWHGAVVIGDRREHEGAVGIDQQTANTGKCGRDPGRIGRAADCVLRYRKRVALCIGIIGRDRTAYRCVLRCGYMIIDCNRRGIVIIGDGSEPGDIRQGDRPPVVHQGGQANRECFIAFKFGVSVHSNGDGFTGLADGKCQCCG